MSSLHGLVMIGCDEIFIAPRAPLPHARVDHHTEAIAWCGAGRNAIRLGLNHGGPEGLNSLIRLIRHRSFGFQSATTLIALVYSAATGIALPLPDDFHPRTDRSAAFADDWRSRQLNARG